MFRFIVLTLFLCFWLATNASAQTAYAPASPDVGPNIATAPLSLFARLTEEAPEIDTGLVWRVFNEKPGENGEHALVATAEGGSATFDLPSGQYLVHVAYGRAGAAKLVVVDEAGGAGDLTLRAGGLQLSAEAEGIVIPDRLLRFSVYDGNPEEEGGRKLIALNVPGDRIVRLNEGTYHVVSSYGRINATVRADLQVRPGQVTLATLQHRGAELGMKLVSRAGGDPIANVSWTVLTADGEKVFSSDELTPSMVLSEGSYEVNVRNGETIYRKAFDVSAGRNETVEVRLDLDKV